jgi:hypothetical protein
MRGESGAVSSTRRAEPSIVIDPAGARRRTNSDQSQNGSAAISRIATSSANPTHSRIAPPTTAAMTSELRSHAGTQAGAASAGSKSISTLAPFGSWKKSCQVPYAGSFRSSYETLFSFSFWTVAARSRPVNAM